MGSLPPEIRERIVKAYKKGYKVKEIADIFDVHRWTVWNWVTKTRHPGRKNFKDRSRKPHTIHRKIIPTVEDAVIILRDEFNWGTQRLKLMLQSPPPYIRQLLETALGREWKPVRLSRQSINTILKKHRRNGSPYRETKKDWNFFRAAYPNQMWQIDIKGPFLLDGERWKALLILDDYSRFLLSIRLLKSVTTELVTQEISQCTTRYQPPEKILTDNGPQFLQQFTSWCTNPERHIEVIHTPPYYPQAKGKIERCIRSFNEEFLPLDKVFDHAALLTEDYRGWYNNDRYNLGVQAVPAELYFT